MSEVELMTTEIRGTAYGVGRCTVMIGGAPLAAVAVKAGDDKHVSTEEGAWRWLSQHGLSEHEAQNLVLAGLRESDAGQQPSVREINAAAQEYANGKRVWPPLLKPEGYRLTGARTRGGVLEVRTINGKWMRPQHTGEIVI